MLPKQPAIVGAVADYKTLQALPELSSTTDLCDYIEFRIDALLDHEELLQERLSNCSRPILITVRDPAEGGVDGLDCDRRNTLMLAYLEHASVIDIEIRNLNALQSVVQAARNRQVDILASYHDFDGTPPSGQLHEASQLGRELGADALKFALTTKDSADLHTLLSLQETESQHGPITVMGMGPIGMSSRVVAAQAGALLTYTYLKEANAPGQWSTTSMHRLFQELDLRPPDPD